MVAGTAKLRAAFEIAQGVERLLDGSDRVNEADGIIYGVKVAGFESRNKGYTLGLSRTEFGDAVDKTYCYAKGAYERAINQYEDASIVLNHPKFNYSDSGARSAVPEDRQDDALLGWLKNVRVTESGVYADLHYLKNHPFAARLVEVARRNPSKLALSHEAFFDKPMLVNGRIVLQEIIKVEAVALVAGEPGTTRGLFESAAAQGVPMTKKLPKTAKVRAIFEGWNHLQAAGSFADVLKRSVMEMTGPGQPFEPAGGADVAVETPAVEDAGDPTPMSLDDQVKAAFKTMLMSVIDNAKDLEAAQEQVIALFASQKDLQEKLKGGGSGSGSGSSSGGKDGKNAAETLAAGAGSGSGSGAGSASASATVAAPAAPDRSAAILESVALLAGVPEDKGGPIMATPTVLEAMAALPSKQARETFVAETAAGRTAASQGASTAAPGAPGSSTIPRSAPPPKKPVTETTAPDVEKKYSESGSFATALRG